MKIGLGVGILAWKSGDTLRKTLESYKVNGLLSSVEEVIVLFQEVSAEDIEIARLYDLNYIALKDNIGIGKGFLMLAEALKSECIMLLEHDWVLIERENITNDRLMAGVKLLHNGFDCVRYRHRKKYGYPHFSIDRYKGRELEYFDDWIELYHPHLLDSVHWMDHPDKKWPDKIHAKNEFYVCNSRYANWTNNPCMYKKRFYTEVVSGFPGEGIDLEKNISHWWARNNFLVAQGEGLFKHCDKNKYGTVITRFIDDMLVNSKRIVKILIGRVDD